jgi:two-component system sensor histidine kinase KdpD
VLASLLAVATFDFFFVPPRLSLSVSDTQYLLTFAVMFAVALIISQLAARLRFEATIATYRERRTRALYELGRELAAHSPPTRSSTSRSAACNRLFNASIVLFTPTARAAARRKRQHGRPIWAWRNGCTTNNRRPALAPRPCRPTPCCICR